MAKMVTDKLALDTEVEAFIKRVGGYPHPRNYITEYVIGRKVGNFTTVTVTFIADEKFSDADKETENG